MTFRDRQVAFYKSHEWMRLREAVMAERGRLCEDCLERGIYRAADEVHHMQPLGADTIDDPDIALNPALLRCLCKDCHAKRHASRRYKVDENGKVTIL